MKNELREVALELLFVAELMEACMAGVELVVHDDFTGSIAFLRLLHL
jgi:hypothetical protein